MLSSPHFVLACSRRGLLENSPLLLPGSSRQCCHHRICSCLLLKKSPQHLPAACVRSSLRVFFCVCLRWDKQAGVPLVHDQRAGGVHGERLRDRHVSPGEARGAAEVGDSSREPPQGSRGGECTQDTAVTHHIIAGIRYVCSLCVQERADVFH